LIKGWHKLSLIDYPKHLCTTIFLGGCNFRCFYCHNSDIAFNPGKSPDINISTILEHLDNRKGTIEGVCITGGEPTIEPGLIALMNEIRFRGFKIKLDTNGTRPDILTKCITQKLVDYIAMDIKAPIYKYPLMSGISKKYLNMDAIQKSIDIIKESGIDYEFRTTVVPGFLEKEDIIEIGRWISGAKKYTLQTYRGELGHLPESRLKEYAKSISKYFHIVHVR